MNSTSNTKVISNEIVSLGKLELLVFSSAFVGLAVALPWVAHQFNLAGPVFLPMHLFVLIAGLVFGWRAGLIVGLLTPIVSFITSGMPLVAVLPQITLEIMVYGVVAGFCREKLKLNIYFSLVIALIIGRLGLLMGILFFGTNSVNPLASVGNAISLGWAGILIQLALVPIIAVWIKKFIGQNRGSHS